MPRNLPLCALLGSLLLLAAPFQVVSAEDDDVDEKDVVVLTDKNFADTISGAKFALVSASGPARCQPRSQTPDANAVRRCSGRDILCRSVTC